jgi:hypothetical protein
MKIMRLVEKKFSTLVYLNRYIEKERLERKHIIMLNIRVRPEGVDGLSAVESFGYVLVHEEKEEEEDRFVTAF